MRAVAYRFAKIFAHQLPSGLKGMKVSAVTVRPVAIFTCAW